MTTFGYSFEQPATMSKRRRTKVDSLPNVSGSSEIQTSHIIPPPSEVEALLSDYSFFKENPSFIRDNDAFIKNIAYCRNLQSEITDAIDRRILSSVEPTLRKEQQNILWNLVQYVNRNDLMLNEEMFAGVTQLATDLVFSSATRYKPKSRHRREEDERICDWFEEEEYARDDYYLDSTRWSVHQLTYELILRVLLFQGARDSYIIITYWNEELLRKLLDLFVSPDSRERDYILSIVHVFYKSVVKFRRFIREFISVRIQSIVFEGGSSTEGVTEMLEFCSAIIRGFAIPLKKEHEDFLMRCLLPLHRLENLNSFYPSLLFCVMAYLEKNACLAAPVLKYLLRRWPVSNSSKVVRGILTWKRQYTNLLFRYCFLITWKRF